MGNEGAEHLSFTTKKKKKKTGVVQGEIAFLFILHTSPSHLSDQYPVSNTPHPCLLEDANFSFQFWSNSSS